MTRPKPKLMDAKEPAAKPKPEKRAQAPAVDAPRRTARTRAGASRESKSDTKQRASSKIAIVVSMLRAKAGASVDQLMEATKWQRHSVRGAISGAIKRKLGLKVRVDKTDQGRIYRIVS